MKIPKETAHMKSVKGVIQTLLNSLNLLPVTIEYNFLSIIATDDDGLTDYRMKTGTPGMEHQKRPYKRSVVLVDNGVSLLWTSCVN